MKISSNFFDIECKNFVFGIVGTISCIESEITFVKRTRNVKVSIGVVSNNSVIENESSFVRTHLLSSEVTTFRDVEDSQLRIGTVSYSATPVRV